MNAVLNAVNANVGILSNVEGLEFPFPTEKAMTAFFGRIIKKKDARTTDKSFNRFDDVMEEYVLTLSRLVAERLNATQIELGNSDPTFQSENKVKFKFQWYSYRKATHINVNVLSSNCRRFLTLPDLNMCVGLTLKDMDAAVTKIVKWLQMAFEKQAAFEKEQGEFQSVKADHFETIITKAYNTLSHCGVDLMSSDDIKNIASSLMLEEYPQKNLWRVHALVNGSEIEASIKLHESDISLSGWIDFSGHCIEQVFKAIPVAKNFECTKNGSTKFEIQLPQESAIALLENLFVGQEVQPKE